MATCEAPSRGGTDPGAGTAHDNAASDNGAILAYVLIVIGTMNIKLPEEPQLFYAF
jgi:hypothetical protein